MIIESNTNNLGQVIGFQALHLCVASTKASIRYDTVIGLKLIARESCSYDIKGLPLRRQTRTHCGGSIRSNDGARPWQIRGNIVERRADTRNVSEGFPKHLLCPGHKMCVRHKCCARGKTSPHELTRSRQPTMQCRHNCRSSLCRGVRQLRRLIALSESYTFLILTNNCA